MTTLLYWMPRIASLLFVVFLSLFAFDVLGEYRGLELLTALFMHLLPSLFLAVAIAVAWRFELVGTAAFFGFAAWYVWMMGLSRPLSWYATIALPCVIIGMLYFANWYMLKGKSERL